MITAAGALQVGIQNVSGRVENGSAVPESAKHKIVIWSSNSTLRYLPMRNENMHLHQDMDINAHSIMAVKYEKPTFSPTGKG